MAKISKSNKKDLQLREQLRNLRLLPDHRILILILRAEKSPEGTKISFKGKKKWKMMIILRAYMMMTASWVLSMVIGEVLSKLKQDRMMVWNKKVGDEVYFEGLREGYIYSTSVKWFYIAWKNKGMQGMRALVTL